MTVTVANTANTNTFDFWRNRTNELADAMTTKAVTTNSNTATGNAAITGTFSANALTSNVSVFVGNSSVNVTVNATSIYIANSSSNIAINVPSAAAKAAGEYFLNANGSWTLVVSPTSNGSVNTTGTSPVLIDSYLTNTYRSMEYTVHVTHDAAVNAYQVSKLLTFHDVGEAYITEFATMQSNNTYGSLGSFTANSNTSHVRVYMTPVPANTVVRFNRTYV